MTRRDSERIAGIFVGGRGSRMGGVPKGLLVAPDGESILGRTRRLLEQAGARCVLVGAHRAYAHLDMETLEDEPAAEGPMAGLLALLRYVGEGEALAIACDMPLLAPPVLARLVDAAPAPIVAPRRQLWEPLFARYDAAVVLPAASRLAARRVFALQALMSEVGAVALPLTSEEERSLLDWDTPADLRGGADGSNAR